jgi:thioredoxin 1
MTQSDRQSSVTPVNGRNFEAEVLRAELPVLIDVSTRWCAPCKAAHAVVAALAQAHPGRLKVVQIDGEASPELVERLDVRGFPTFIGVARGQVVERRVGFGGRRPLEELARALLEPSSGQELPARLFTAFRDLSERGS